MPNGQHDAPETSPRALPPVPSPWAAHARLVAELLIGALLVTGVVWLILLKAETRRLRRELGAARDSVALVTSYNYGGLITDILDLQTELYARKADTIPGIVGPVRLPPPNITERMTGALPLPAFPSGGPDADEQARAAAQLTGAVRPTRAEVRVVYHQGDVQASGADARLTALGFAVERRAADRPNRPSNAITIGAQVSEADARAAALALIAAGLDPKRLRRSVDPALARTIEIEHVQALLDWPGLRVADLNRIAAN